MEDAAHVNRVDTSPMVLKVVLLGTAMFAAMGGPALAPALPSIKAAYITIPNIEFWTKSLVAISALFGAIGAPLFGWLSDRYDRRKVLFAAIAMWGVSGASGMIPQPFWSLLLGRAVLGLSLGGLLAANSVMIANYFSHQQRRHMMGLQGTCNSSGVVLSLIVCGMLASYHWRAAFCVFLLALLLLPFVPMIRPPSTSDSKRQVIPPAVPMWSIPLVMIFFFGFSGMLAFNVIPTQFPFYLHQLSGASPAKIGLLVALLPVSSAIASRLYSRLSSPVNMWLFFAISGSIMCAGFFALSISLRTEEFVGSIILIGAGVGMMNPHVNTVLSEIVAAKAMGRSMGLLTSSKFIGLFLSPILAQPFIVYFGYATMLRVAGVFTFVVALVLCLSGILFHHQKKSAS